MGDAPGFQWEMVSREATASRLKALSTLPTILTPYVLQYASMPVQGSQAWSELASCQRTVALQVAYGYGHVNIEAAVDYVAAVSKTSSEPVSTVAPLALLRGAMEASSVACWVMATDILPKERMQRGYALRYRSLAHQLTWSNSTKNDASAKHARERIDVALQQAALDGIAPTVTRKGEIDSIGVRIPSNTELAKHMLDDESLYHLLSAGAHSQAWALIPLCFREMDLRHDVPPVGYDESTDLRYLKRSISSLTVAWLCMAGLRFAAKPFWTRAVLFGWDTEELSRILNDVSDDMGLANNQVRFWNQP